MAGLGAIAKSVGGALVKKKAKQVATDKLMGRGKKKDSGIVKSKTNKEIIGNLGASSGKFYYEAEFQVGNGNFDGAGWVCLDGFGVDGTTEGGYTMFLRDNGSTVVGNTNSRTDTTGHEIFIKGDTIGCAIDLDNRIAKWYKNGVQSSFSHDFSSASGGTLVGKPFIPYALHRFTGSIYQKGDFQTTGFGRFNSLREFSR